MTPWQQALRVGLAPQLSTDTLAALLAEVEAGGPRLIQRAYAEPLPVFTKDVATHQPWRQCCLVGICAALATGATTSNEVYPAAECIVVEMMRRLSDTTGLAFNCALIAWWDDTPREESLPLLAEELQAILVERWSKAEYPLLSSVKRLHIDFGDGTSRQVL